MIAKIKDKTRGIIKRFPWLENWLNVHKQCLQILGFAFLNAAILYGCLEIGNKNLLFNGPFYTFVNIITVFILQSAVFLIVQRWWIASAVTGLPVAVLSIANYYTLLFRNQPISPQDIHNVGTTMSVIEGYKFSLSIYVILIILLYALSIYIVLKLFRLEKGKKLPFKRTVIKNGCLILCSVLFLHVIYFSKKPIKPQTTFVWSWEETYYTYGFAASSIEVFQNSMNAVSMPNGYSEEQLKSLIGKKAEYTDYQTPDVIIILNETFYDLRDLVDIETDTEFMPFIDNLQGAIKGRAVVAGTGGGTNKSEYELLTSNSLQLTSPGITPFNYLDFNNANSIVNYLKGLGYNSWGAHCAPALNYSRGNVYPKLGFDMVKFNTDFKNSQEKYGERHYVTDEATYEEMIEDYERMGEDPRMMYLLTIQNHGGWEMNEESLDLVHTSTDFGDYTDDINEYLTCMKMSDMAFEKLTKYFEGVDRPVIVCMVGDHAPSFAQELNKERDEETVFNLRSTPYVIWANFEFEKSYTENVSMPMLVPRMLEAARIPLSPYYSYMLELSRKVPVVTANGVYKDKEGKIYYYDKEKNEYTDALNTYFNLVYNNMGNKAKRIDELFMPIK